MSNMRGTKPIDASDLNRVVQYLLKLGHTERLHSPVPISVGNGRYSIIGPEFWPNTATSLSGSDRIALFKGLVLAEKLFRWPGGSVAANIWVLQQLESELETQKYEELLDWALRNRGDNPYTPLGRQSEARNLAEHRQEVQDRSTRMRQHAERTATQQQEKKLRLLRKEQGALAHAKRSDERRQARKGLIHRLMGESADDRLRWLSSQQDYPVSALPLELFPPEATGALDDQTLAKLATRLEGLSKSPKPSVSCDLEAAE